MNGFIGETFNRLTVLEVFKKDSRTFFRCICACGIEKELAAYRVKNGSVKSCGCLAREKFKDMVTKHGRVDSPEYHSWRGMRERCNNPKNSHYPSYGGRGISYPEEWNNFEGFFEDMGVRPEGTTLDRIDVDKNYSKENCKWSTVHEQAMNTRIRASNRSGYKGVYPNNGKFDVSYRGIYIASFDDIDLAIELRKKYESGEIKLNDSQMEKLAKKKESKRLWDEKCRSEKKK